MSLIADITEWLEDALTRNQIVHDIDRTKAREFVLLGKREAEGLCTAHIWHGPGHQSRTFCDITTEHEVHSCEYGSMRQIAEWKGQEVYSDFFDEPPRLEE